MTGFLFVTTRVVNMLILLSAFCFLPFAYCFLPSDFLPSASDSGKDAREAQYLDKAKERLNLLHPVPRYENLIAGN